MIQNRLSSDMVNVVERHLRMRDRKKESPEAKEAHKKQHAHWKTKCYLTEESSAGSPHTEPLS